MDAERVPDEISKTVCPTEIGWRRRKIWERPDGTLHEFAPNAPELVVIYTGPPLGTVDP